MGHRTATEGYRVLIAAPFGRDAESLRELLAGQGYAAQTCGDLATLAEANCLVVIPSDAEEVRTGELVDVAFLAQRG